MSSTPPTPRRKPPPQRVASPLRRRRWFWLLVLGVALLLCVLASAVGYCLVTSFIGVGFVPAGSGNTPIGGGSAHSTAAVATDFLGALKARNYAQAYSDLDSTLLASMTPDDFVHQAEQADACYGALIDYTLTQNVAGQFTYAVRRSKLPKAYLFQLTLGQDSQENWAITDYGPGQTLNLPGAAPCQ